ncbi:hypothetical protein [Bernardetia sp.]|uniref:hypothetical protein n=1 Tax=Bernardetia sp. TaxID=1937974 RepID=UPI0025BC27F3|nr:hypothetical protein [Bernardetia sp.]
MNFAIRNFKEKSSKWLLLSATALTIGLSSCEKEDQFLETKTNDITSLDAKNAQGENIYDSQSENQRIFGKALLEAMKESSALRKFIKTEALKKFNHDYDVLFATVKNTVIEDGKTFRDIMLENVANEEVLKQIEITNPLLTIFVPSLPDNSFSAETWDTENQIPDVALRLHTTNDVPCFSLDKGNYTLEAKYIPSYPIVVIKQNERVISSLNKGYESITDTRIIKTIEGVEYKFTDSNYDNRKVLNRVIFNFQMDEKVEEAYNIYKNIEGWHRDYIYYGIEPSNPNGRFTLDYKEHITTFRMNEGIEGYNKIADQTGDQQIVHMLIGDANGNMTSSGWTDGAFDFKVDFVFISNDTDEPTGIVRQKRFGAIGSKLFDVTYRRERRAFYGSSLYLYVLDKIEPKTLHLGKDVPLINWDLKKYSLTMEIKIEEVDLDETFSISETYSSQFANNFSISPVSEKVGLQFGGDASISSSKNVSVNYTMRSDELGSKNINFGDDFIIKKGSINLPGIGNQTYFETREYSSGDCSISVEPLRVQGF